MLFHCEPGLSQIGSWSVKHPDIELGRIPDQRLGLPVDVSVLDALAFAEILSADQIVEEGMRARIEKAIDTCTAAVATALEALQPLGITECQLQCVVNAHVKNAAERLRKPLRVAEYSTVTNLYLADNEPPVSARSIARLPGRISKSPNSPGRFCGHPQIHSCL